MDLHYFLRLQEKIKLKVAMFMSHLIKKDILEESPLKENVLVDILLSTYNGSKYLQKLMNSIINQTYQNWRLLIRDDGSTDGTINIIHNFVKQFPTKIIYIEDQYNNLGPSQSFSKLIEYSNANYIMFCDQDDIWLNNKIELILEKMLQLEKEFQNKPLLVHTDLTVVDKDLQVISNSFWKYQKLNPAYKNLNHLLIQNIATGCTMMMNKRLKELAHPIPDKAIMHDWWIALVASIYSGIYHINASTILYRQHGENNTGAKKYSLHYFLSRSGKANESMKRIIQQGEQLSIRYKDQLNKDQFKLVESFITLFHKNRFARLMDIFVYRFRKHGFLRNVGLIITVFFLRCKSDE
ncbi:glycosyltransferase family 2 protein [Microaerobacter geothermalis]|uniref:glycosyltransferase family 2 protein n=1 Tax=Microaerobacter geothermalis TaxID=674972 RepID=UPI001F4055C2|nr:glycosyltransferase family 2 protein [Microaerobacter geothermalis]MCF6093264.1 glycosyltransferase family 2 protein [Microaerobacter geothermalis]